MQSSGSEVKEPETTLAKLGSEVHGPEDKMQINKDHVLFIEDLKDDSTVVKSIRQGK